ncbi:MAG: Oar protein, partial [Acidobacteriaceae bacterium]|nr:Oar protein [Acidobacteriaceae bacterium]
MRPNHWCESHTGGRAVGVGSSLVRYSFLIVAVLALVCSLNPPLHAKVAAGISGIVTDPSGAVVSGAAIQVKAIETGIVETRQTNAEGFFAFVNLQPGRYDLEVRQTGFTAYRQTGILLDVDSAKILNVTLKLGQVSERVDVSGEAVQLDTASTQLGEVISARTITAVPLVTRSYTDLLALQPGVTPSSSGLAGGQGGQFSATGFTFTNVSGDLNAGNLSVNGQRESSNGFLLNGTTVQEFAFSGTAIIPNLDSIAEFRIVTNNFDAEYGNYAGGQINVITKSGSNRFHGGAFEFLRNTAFDGTNYFSKLGKDDHKQNQFGGTIGGPIAQNKLFFFGDYQGNRVVQGQSGGTGLTPVPTAAQRTGDFSALAGSLTGVVQGPAWAQQLSNTLGYAVTQGEPYYFSGCTSAQCVFPGAQIPTSAFTAPSQKLLQFVPPGNAGDGEFTPVVSPARLSDNKASGRVDYNSHMGLLTGYYFFDQYRQSVPNIFLPGFGSDFTGRSQVVNVGDSKTLGTASV